ncbi:MAG: glycine betaine ABC transporter substrate-binding protein [Pseudomonadota bacterium]
MKRVIQIALAACVLLAFNVSTIARAEPIVVGSKNFNESYILAEIMAQLLEAKGFEVKRQTGLGGTTICYEALKTGEIDVYAEYTGTLSQVILKTGALAPTVDELNAGLAADDLSVLPSLGFNNTYAITLKATLAESRGLTKVSELAGQDLNVAVSHEFLNREDGWPGLAARYSLDQQPTGIEHGLAYQAIDEGKIDVTDAYSTDGDLERYGLTTLIDDRGYFPQYFAVPFIRNDLPLDAIAELRRLTDSLDDASMRALNARVVVDGEDFATVAHGFLLNSGLIGQEVVIKPPETWELILSDTIVHLKLTGIAVLISCLVGIPLGVVVFRAPVASKAVLYVAGLMQTIPSLALLALMIPLFGLGEVPAVIALTLYALLPILRNTITALITIDPELKRVSLAIGLSPTQQLRYALMPMALPNILAGIKTAAVIAIGTATLAAFVGAGGLGEPIVTGLSLNDMSLILRGAIPAAVLAIIVEFGFDRLERALVPAHMLSGKLPE